MPASVLWLALFAGLSPTLLDLARHWLDSPWALPSSCFVLLWLLAAREQPRGHRARAPGLVLVVGGLLIAAFAATGGFTRFGRLGMVASVIGLALYLGRPAPVAALLVLWWIPVPQAMQKTVFGELSAIVEALARSLASLTGTAPLYASRELLPSTSPIRLAPVDTGLQAAWLLAGLGWYAAVRGGSGAADAVRPTLRPALLAVPLQLVALAVAAGLALLGASAFARSWLDGFPALVTACGLAWLLATRRRRGLILTQTRMDAGSAG